MKIIDIIHKLERELCIRLTDAEYEEAVLFLLSELTKMERSEKEVEQ